MEPLAQQPAHDLRAPLLRGKVQGAHVVLRRSPDVRPRLCQRAQRFQLAGPGCQVHRGPVEVIPHIHLGSVGYPALECLQVAAAGGLVKGVV